jgi:hypothetical protein
MLGESIGGTSDRPRIPSSDRPTSTSPRGLPWRATGATGEAAQRGKAATTCCSAATSPVLADQARAHRTLPRRPQAHRVPAPRARRPPAHRAPCRRAQAPCVRPHRAQARRRRKARQPQPHPGRPTPARSTPMPPRARPAAAWPVALPVQHRRARQARAAASAPTAAAPTGQDLAPDRQHPAVAGATLASA